MQPILIIAAVPREIELIEAALDEALIEPAARYFAQLAEKALQHV